MTGIFSNILLITDLDGTLLPHSKIISDTDIKNIKSFTDNGGHFSIATGRPFQSAEKYLEVLSVNAPAILYNGSCIFDSKSDKSNWCRYLNKNSRELISDVLKRFPEASAEILTADNVYAIQINDTERYHMSITNNIAVESTLENVGDKWLKALFAMEPERINELIDYIDKEKYKDISFVQSCRFFYEMLPQNISKGYALKILKEQFGYKDYTIVAVGDYDNDIEMLGYADISFATANANDNVKKIVDFVLEESCEDNAISAVIKYINTHLAK